MVENRINGGGNSSNRKGLLSNGGSGSKLIEKVFKK